MLYQVKVKQIKERLDSPISFEDQINQWLAENPKVTIMDIKYSQVTLSRHNGLGIRSSVLIMYREFVGGNLTWPTEEEVKQHASGQIALLADSEEPLVRTSRMEEEILEAAYAKRTHRNFD